MSTKVYVFDPTADDQLSKVRGIGRYLQILRENFKNEFVFVNGLASIIKNSASIFINPFFNFLKYPLIMKRVAKKQIAVIHDLIPLKYPEQFPAGIKGSLNIFLNKLSLKNYDSIVTDSQTSKLDIVKILRIEPEKIKVIYPCLPKIFTDKKLKTQKLNVKTISENSNLDKFKDRFNIGNYCLYVGDVTWNKNLVNIAKAIKIADVKCVFVGKVFEILKRVQDDNTVGVASEETLREADCPDVTSGQSLAEEKYHERQNLLQLINPWQKEFRQFLEETKDDKRFIFAGFIPDNELIKLYQQAVINILVSRDEGFGFSYVEAGIFGCPSIVSDIPIFKEIAGENNALFVDPNNLNQISKAIGDLFINKNKRDEIGFKAQQRAKEFNQKKFKDVFLKVLNF